MRSHKGSTIYKSRSCDLGPGHAVRACNRNKAGLWPGVRGVCVPGVMQ
jgi:hypothetical protein